MTNIGLTEWETTNGVELSPSQVAMLVSSDVVRLAPDALRAGLWQLSAQNYVGAVVMDGLVIRIQPKVGVRRLVKLLARHIGQLKFAADTIEWGTGDDLTEVIAHAFATETEQTLAQGPLNGYRAIEESLLTVRGRINMGRQVAVRGGLPLPVEVTYDDFTADIPENGLLVAAAHRLINLPHLTPEIHQRLLRIIDVLRDVTPRFDPRLGNAIAWSRLNEHYRVPIGLAALVLDLTTIEDSPPTTTMAHAFVVDMSRVFEAEIAAGIRQAARGMRLTIESPHSTYLDNDRFLRIRPDIAVFADRKPVAIADMKYKLADAGRIEIGDVYQALAYAHRLGLASAHLIYPVRPPMDHLVIGDVTIHLHCVDLNDGRSEMEARFSILLESMIRFGRRQLGSTAPEGPLEIVGLRPTRAAQ